MCSCNEGYKLDPDGITCLDIDECVEEDNGGCMMNCEYFYHSNKIELKITHREQTSTRGCF